MFVLSAVSESSSEDDGGASDLDGFDSYDEEEYQNKRDPFEDGEDSQLPECSEQHTAALQRSPRPSRPATRSSQPLPAPPPQSSPPARPAKRSRATRAPPPAPPPQLSWKTDKEPDTAPPVSRFHPARTPGPQLSSTSTYTPLDLFKLFLPVQTVQTLCQNTNKQAAKQILHGKKFKWTDLDVGEFYEYIGLLLNMALVNLDSLADYSRQNHFLSVPTPSQIMPLDRYRTISWNLHLSDPDEDVHNDRKKGTADHDKLFRLKPLMDTIKIACKAFYHPHRELAVGDRMVASKATTGTDKRFKLFVLADSRNGYTVDFSIYTGGSQIPSGHGLSYDVVMSLVRAGYLGTGYHIYMDSWYSSPKLFRALHACKFAACGTSKECPRTGVNALKKTSERGSMRWIRDGPIVYVKWMDTREVSVCSTIHTAHSGKTVQRRVKRQDGSWTRVSVPCPTPVAEYNEHMGGLQNRANELVPYYSAQHKTARWYRNLFYHFLDIAATNSYILHTELCLAQQTKPMTQRAFMEELSAELLPRHLQLLFLCPLLMSDQRTPE